MKKNLFKYIFITMFAVCMSFMLVQKTEAKTVEIKITGDTRDAVFYSQVVDGLHICFNIKKYGGAEASKAACENICSKACSVIPVGSYSCTLGNIKSTVTVDMGEKYPIKLVYDDTTINSGDAKIITKDCFMTYNVWTPNKEVWGCKNNEDCVNGCAGTCEGLKIKYKDANGDVSKGTAFFCLNNNVKPNLFVDVNGQLMSWDSVHKTPEEAIAVTGENESLLGVDEWSDIPALLDGVSNLENGKIACDDEAIVAVMAFAQKIFAYMRIGAVALLILLSVIDFMGVVSSDSGDAMKKATQKFVKRAVFTVALIILPSLINLIFNIVSIVDGMCVIS